MKLTFRYIFFVELYSGVDLFSVILGLGLGLGLGIGIDNLKNILKYLIGGAANTLDIPCR